MITAITNTTSRVISGTSYYSDGCLYTTSYSEQTEIPVQYVSTITNNGTYYTSSVETKTRTTYLGSKSDNVHWDVTRKDNSVWNTIYATSPVELTVSGIKHYSWSQYKTSETTHVGWEWSYIGSYETVETVAFNDWAWTYTWESIREPQWEGDVYFRDYRSYSLSNISLTLKHDSNEYTVTFSDSNEWLQYTSGSGSYGIHTGNIYQTYDGMYTSFDYINFYETVNDTYTARSVFTTDGEITEGFVTATSGFTVYPRVTYTISSHYEGRNVSASKDIVVNSYTQTISATDSFPSMKSGLRVQYYVVGTCSTEMNENDNKPRDRKYTTTNYFSVSNQRNKSYLISMAIRDNADGRFLMEDVTCYVIPPYYDRFVGSDTNTVNTWINNTAGIEEVSVRTAYKSEWHSHHGPAMALEEVEKNVPYYGLSVFEINDLNMTDWKPVVSISQVRKRGDFNVTYRFNDSVSGITLGNQIFSTSTIPPHWHEKRTDGNWGRVGFLGKEIWTNQRQTYENTSSTYIDTITEPIDFNGYGVMTYDFSYVVSTTYYGPRTHFVTGE